MRIVRGMRDFGPLAVAQREHVFRVLRTQFLLHGFSPLETPAMEDIATLTGKYGDEGEQLLFRVLNSGVCREDLTKAQGVQDISGKGLRYDLTVPLARYIHANADSLSFPFRRYQMQPVWRADRPQKGRYREFFQCDADVIGAHGPIVEAELLEMALQGFCALGLQDVRIHIGHRKLLGAIVQLLGLAAQEHTACIILDKLDKIGPEKVTELLLQEGMPTKALGHLEHFLACSERASSSQPGNWNEELGYIEKELTAVPQALAVLQELRDLRSALEAFHGDAHTASAFVLNPLLARGLGYYTGTIFEVKLPEASLGSLGGGGRYDGLTHSMGGRSLPGVGFSFGFERIYALLQQRGGLDHIQPMHSQVMVAMLDAPVEAIHMAQKLRAQGLRVSVYASEDKMAKQLRYADAIGATWVVVLGQREVDAACCVLRHMPTKEQTEVRLDAEQVFAAIHKRL